MRNREDFIKEFNKYVDEKIKSMTKKEKEDYFNAKDSALSEYQLDYLKFGKREKCFNGKSKFF